MRPTKLTQRVISIFNEVLATDHNALVCTDEDLCILVNDKLNEHERISYRTFQRYKAKAMKMMSEEKEAKEKEEQQKTTEPDDTKWLYQKLYVLWRKATIKQKNRLMDMVLEAKQGWQRYKWLLERKMQEWQQIPETDDDKPDEPDWSKYRLGMTFS